MIGVRRPSHGRLAALLLLVMLVPFVRHVLESTMSAQMLVEIPLLVAVGWMLERMIPSSALAKTEPWNRHGISGLVLVTAVSAFWMLPRSLDAATTNPLMVAAKFLAVPLLVGLPLAVTWPRIGFVARGVVLVEFVATFFRLGWLYLISPIRLCNNYALDDQQRLGRYMLMIGSALVVWFAWKLIWGRFEEFSGTEAREPASA